MQPSPSADAPLETPLFVYGTLKPGQSRWPAIAHDVVEVGEGTAPGSLIITQWGWPAADFAAEGTIHGVAVRPVDPEATARVLQVCDRMEDVPHLFRRVTVRIAVGGDEMDATAYEWQPSRGPAPGDPSPTGRWPA